MSHMLREWSSFADSKMVLEFKENQSGGKDCYLKGIAIQAEKRNLNERVYPQHEIERAVKVLQEKLNRGESILCECDHPEDLNINLDRVAGMITKIWMEGSNGMAVIKILPTTHGENIRKLLENGVKLGVSSRGAGDVDYDGVVSGYEIITIDIVAQPSAPDAYPVAVFESLYNKKGALLNNNNMPINESKGISSSLESEILDFFVNLKQQ